MKPEEKSPEVDNMLTSIFGVNRKSSIAANVCVSCGRPAVEFRDGISQKEFGISGFCQECQDQVFGE